MSAGDVSVTVDTLAYTTTPPSSGTVLTGAGAATFTAGVGAPGPGDLVALVELALLGASPGHVTRGTVGHRGTGNPGHVTPTDAGGII